MLCGSGVVAGLASFQDSPLLSASTSNLLPASLLNIERIKDIYRTPFIPLFSPSWNTCTCFSSLVYSSPLLCTAEPRFSELFFFLPDRACFFHLPPLSTLHQFTGCFLDVAIFTLDPLNNPSPPCICIGFDPSRLGLNPAQYLEAWTGTAPYCFHHWSQRPSIAFRFVVSSVRQCCACF